MSLIENLNEQFVDRHIGPDFNEREIMLDKVGAKSIDELIDQTVPANIRMDKSLSLPQPLTEVEFLENFKSMMSQNKVYKSYIGMGYHNCVVPGVIQRNILENPAWYTAYTPYQAEIAQGRLEALINYQTVVIELTGMEIANASLLDEGTAAAEAVSLLYRVRSKTKKTAHKIFIDKNIFPQTLDVVKGRAVPVGIEVVISDISELDVTDPDLFGVFLQYPDNNGAVINNAALIEAAIENDVKSIVAADLMSLVLLQAPGDWGVDVVVGTSQRFGVPLGYGGPHAAYFATKESYKRQTPGRIIGATEDRYGNLAYRMALQTREQHIKRERATSNICTAQVLLSVMAGMYAVYHGKSGLKRIAERIHLTTVLLEKELAKLGCKQLNEFYFDTLKVKVNNVDAIKKRALQNQVNFRFFEDGCIGISVNETTSLYDVKELISIFDLKGSNDDLATGESLDYRLSDALQRKTTFLDHEVFNKYQPEHEMLRYIKSLENKDLSLVHSMISLGSCTMKLNATTEMAPLSWNEVGNIHPFVPVDQVKGYHQLFSDLEAWLSEITGMYATSLQPNSGAQGEYAGLMSIRGYYLDKGEEHRNITLIPSSAHGTNPATAIMAGQEVKIVKCLENGDIDIDDLREKAELYKDRLMALMVTYPSTHGVFEEGIKEACKIIHNHGGMVYMDGANLNAQLGLTSPAHIGADVCHLNLHKTFCIPHGGGGPGMGPIAVVEALEPYLPGSVVIDTANHKNSIEAISAAPWGSASILSISYAYIAMMGAQGLKTATEIAILSANYIGARLKGHYDILFTGQQGRNAHELIIDCRSFKEYGVTVTDIAKRLMDYGFHAPTVSFPVAGTLMIEPTESETIEEVDRFCDAMINIRREIKEIASGKAEKGNNVLVNSPHTLDIITNDEWSFPYSRAEAAFPLPYVKAKKFWASVSRINDAMGDRNLICSCIPVSAFEDEPSEQETINA